MKTSLTRCYSELIQFNTFEERFDYLKLQGKVGADTFGFDRYLNQQFYTSRIWRDLRRTVIIRDAGCDLGIPDKPILSAIRVHHMNPITARDLSNASQIVLDPEYLICTSLYTHNALHYGNRNNLLNLSMERKKGDTKLW